MKALISEWQKIQNLYQGEIVWFQYKNFIINIVVAIVEGTELKSTLFVKEGKSTYVVR